MATLAPGIKPGAYGTVPKSQDVTTRWTRIILKIKSIKEDDPEILGR